MVAEIEGLSYEESLAAAEPAQETPEETPEEEPEEEPTPV